MPIPLDGFRSDEKRGFRVEGLGSDDKVGPGFRGLGGFGLRVLGFYQGFRRIGVWGLEFRGL